MDLFPNEQNFDLAKSTQNVITAWKSITKLVIFNRFLKKGINSRV
jgi:hypothetical protein